jgi:hypothetical protein
LGEVARGIDRLERGPAATALDEHTRRAFHLLASSGARRAFEVGLEPDTTRELYGQTPFGQATLLARRLVEAGVRLVQVNWYRGPDEPDANPCWDTHVSDPQRLKEVLVPPADRAIAALISDLDARGMLDETIVAVISEFGRTPKIEPNGGRGHWGAVFSVVLAGGGIRGGLYHGASDALGGHPRDGKVTPEELSATIFHCLGVDPATELQDRLGRPVPVSRGRPIAAIL